MQFGRERAGNGLGILGDDLSAQGRLDALQNIVAHAGGEITVNQAEKHGFHVVDEKR